MFNQSGASRNIVSRSQSETVMIEKYNKDKYLLKTLHRNKYSSFVNKTDRLSDQILTSFKQFDKTTKQNIKNYKKRKEENDTFREQFTKIKKINNFFTKKGITISKFLNSNNFNEIISQYHKRGLKIPKLSTDQNNIFKVDPLLTKKAKTMNEALGYDITTANKSILYLRKLKELVTLLSSGDIENLKNYFSKDHSNFFGDKLLITELKQEYKKRNEIEREKVLKETKLLLDLIERTCLPSLFGLNTQVKQNQSTSTFEITIQKSHDNLESINRETREYKAMPIISLRKKPSLVEHIDPYEYREAINNIAALKRKSISNLWQPIRSSASIDSRNIKPSDSLHSRCMSCDEEREFLPLAYDLMLNGKFEEVNDILKLFLNKFKKCDEREIQHILSAKNTNSHNIYNLISSLEKQMERRNLPEKIRKIYTDSNKITHINNKLIELSNTEREIKTLNCKLLSKLNQNSYK